jgi:hypothetical protein
MEKISCLRAEFTYNTRYFTTQKSRSRNIKLSNKLGFDHMESYFIGVQGNPSSNMRPMSILMYLVM